MCHRSVREVEVKLHIFLISALCWKGVRCTMDGVRTGCWARAVASSRASWWIVMVCLSNQFDCRFLCCGAKQQSHALVSALNCIEQKDSFLWSQLSLRRSLLPCINPNVHRARIINNLYSSIQIEILYAIFIFTCNFDITTILDCF